MFGQNSGSGGGFGGGGGGFGGGGFGAGAGANPNATPWSPNTPFGGGGAPAPAQTPLAAAAPRAGAREAAAALDGTDAFHKGKAIHCALQAARPAPDAGGKGAPGGKGGKGAASAGKGGAGGRRRPLLRQGRGPRVRADRRGLQRRRRAFGGPAVRARAPGPARRPRFHGYANFGSRKEADAACRELKRSAAFGGTPICTVKESREKPSDAGRSLSPPKAAPRPAAPKKAAAGPPRAVLVAKGAPKDERSLKSVFESFGAVESCHVSEAATYVLFEDADAAALAAREMSGIDAFMAGALECAVGAPPGATAPAKAPQFAGAKVWTREAAPPPKEAPKQKPAERADLKARNAERFAAHDISKTPARPRSPRSRSPAKIVQQEAGAADDLVGACLQFCPQDEIDERVRFKELDKYEKPPGHEAMDDDELARRAIPFAMKKYKRSAAGDVQSVPEIVRPPDVLFAAFEHLAAHVIDDAAPGDSEDDQMTRYIFLWNRFRAIRKDFILQNYTTGGNVDARVVRVFEGMARYFIGIEQQLSGHPEWREGIAHGKHNAESLSETLSALLAFYEMGKHAADAGDVLRNEPEFTQYWLIYFLDQEQGAEAGRLLTVLALKRPLLRESDAVRRAAEIKRCREERNYARFFGLVREAPYLVRCLAVAQYADGMRLDALEVMGKAYVKSEPYPAGELADLLCLSGPEEARRRAVDYGYSVDAQGDVLFAATGADVDLDAFGDGGGSKRAPLFGAQDLGAAVRTPRGEADPEAAAKEREMLAAREGARREAAEQARATPTPGAKKAARRTPRRRALRRELVAKQEAAAAEAARQREAARLAAEQAAAEKAAAEQAPRRRPLRPGRRRRRRGPKRSRIDRAVVAEAQASDDFSSWLAGVVGGDA
ncbi:nucleoporin [Aureococcus anophagefferens]|uniref:Nucleoporin n=1 Tax=Aureococcus anophagefferens TaxID=44056 RepID=A0ABR1G581_AURAN